MENSISKRDDRWVGCVKNFLLMSALAFAIGQSQAGGSVAGTGGSTEITQLINKAQLISQSTRQEQLLLQEIEQTYLSRLQQLGMSTGEYTTSYQNTLSTYNQVRDTNSKLSIMQGSLGSLNGALEDRYRQFSASNLSQNDWMARERALINQGDERARAQIISNRNVFESTKTSMDGYQKSAAALNATTGTHAATQLLGAQMSMLGGDLNKLIAITAMENATRNDEKALQFSKDRREQKIREAREMDYQKSDQQSRAFLDRLKSHGHNTGK